MARSGKRDVMEYDCLRRFRRRRLLAFLRRDNLPATFDALKHEARVFFDVRHLQRLVVDGRWQEARGYVNRFLSSREDEVEPHTTLIRFMAQLNVFDDLAHGKLEGKDAVDDLEMQIDAIPSTMSDSNYTEAVRAAFNTRSHPAYWNPVDWQLVRLKASQIVKDLIMQTPKFKLLNRLPQCPIDPRYAIPFGFGGRRRHKRKNIGHISTYLLAQRFHPKERRLPPTLLSQGSKSQPMDLEELIDVTLLAGNLEFPGHLQGIPGSPVGSFVGNSCGLSPADAVKKCSSQEEYSPCLFRLSAPAHSQNTIESVKISRICERNEQGDYAESASGAKLPHATGEFYPGAIKVSSGGIDPMHVLKKTRAMGEISGAMGELLMNTCIGPYHNMFVEKLLEQEKLLNELRVHCIKAKGCTSVATDFTT